MRSIPTALNTHIQAEVLALAKLIRITRLDGRVIRATTHDQDIVVGDETFRSDISFSVSAIQSNDSLAVDNAEATLGLDGVILVKADFENGLYDNAQFDLLFTNWENPSDGTSYLKRGTLGDIKIENEVSVTIGLRGLTQYLQKNVVEKYSPTCRVNLGGKKCGVVNTPIRIRRNRQKVRTFDWFLVPDETEVTNVAVTNSSFESNGDVANGTTGITGWTHGAGSYWQVNNNFSAVGGTYYLAGGDDGAGLSTGTEFTLFREFNTTTIGMGNSSVDDGLFTVDFSAFIASTSASLKNSGRVFVELLDANGITLKLEQSDEIEPTYEEWEGIGATAFVIPGTRRIRVGVRARKTEGAVASIAFDDVALRFWENSMDTFNNAVYRTVRIPTYTDDDFLRLGNASFDTSPVANTNVANAIPSWTITSGSWWSTVTDYGALTPAHGTGFLFGGDNGTNDPAQEYSITQMRTFGNIASADNITAGWYHFVLQARVAKTDVDSNYRIIVEFMNATNTVIETFDTGYDSSVTVDQWDDLRVNACIPSGAVKALITLRARSGADSEAQVAFDNLELFIYPTAYEGAKDAELGYLANSLPDYATAPNSYTIDGDVVVQARPPVFEFQEVTSLVDARSFGVTGINKTASLLYSGKITWLSGANAGMTSFVRVWNNTTKVARLYNELPNEIATGDKFVYALGCDKTIGRCADTFGNAHNFRGEPYLPGTAKVIEFLQTTES